MQWRRTTSCGAIRTRVAIYALSVGLLVIQTIGLRYWAARLAPLGGDALLGATLRATLGLAAVALVLGAWAVILGARRRTWTLLPAALVNLATILWAVPRLGAG